MTTILSMILYIAIITFVFLVILILYYGIAAFYWLWKIKYDYSNTEYESKKFRYYKKKIILVSPIMIILCLTILFYKTPVSFENIVSLEEQQNIKSMYARGNLPNGNDSMEIPIDKMQEVLKILNDYKYRRCINGVIGGQVVFLDLRTDSPRWSIFIEVWDSGYIRIPNHKIYKVLNEDMVKLFDRITKLLE